MHTNIGVALNPILWVLCCKVMYFFKDAFSSIHLRILNLHNKSPKIFAYPYIWFKMLSSCLYAMLKLSKTTSPQKTIRLWLHNPVPCRWPCLHWAWILHQSSTGRMQRRSCGQHSWAESLLQNVIINETIKEIEVVNVNQEYIFFSSQKKLFSLPCKAIN